MKFVLTNRLLLSLQRHYWPLKLLASTLVLSKYKKKRANSLAIKSITQPVERAAQLEPVKNQEESMRWSTFLVKLPVSKLYIFYSKGTKSRVKFFRIVCVENLGVTAAVFFMCCIKLIIQKFY